MCTNIKIKYELQNKFEPCFTSQFPLLLSNKNELFCGRSDENSINVNILNGSSLYPIGTLKDDDCITSFIVNPLDSTLVYSTRSMLLKLIDTSTLKVMKTWNSCHQRPVLKLAIKNCSTRLATGSGDTVVRIWHIGPQEGFCASCRGHTGMITLLQFHPNRGLLFSSALGDYHVAVWDSEDGNRVGTLDGHQANVTSIAFSHDKGRVIATCGRDKVVILWSSRDFSRQNLIPAFESLEACIFLPKGALINHLGDSVKDQSLLLTGGQWGCLRVWQPDTGRCLLEIKGPLDRIAQDQKNRQSIDYGLHSIVSLQLAQTQLAGEDIDTEFRLVLTRQSNHIEFYNPSTVKLISEGLGDIGQVDQLCIVGKAHNYLLLADASPQLKLFLQPYGLKSSGHDTDQIHTIDRSWRCHLVPGGHTDVITDISVSGCGVWVVTGSKDHSLCLWQVVEPESDSLTDRSAAKAKLVLVERLENAHAAHLSAVGLNRSATVLLSAAGDNILKVWSLNEPTDQPTSSSKPPGISEITVVPGAHSSTINSIDVSINNQLVATASRDRTVKIWKLSNRNLEYFGVLQGHRRGVWSVRFSTREKLVLTASGDGDIKLWNLKDFSCIRTLEGHDQPVYRAVFLSQERQVLSCDQRGLVRLWDLNKPSSNKASSDPDSSTNIGGTNNVYEAHKGRIWSLVVCPDESGFYTGGEDETLCYFRDVTKEMEQDSTKKMEDFIQTQQALDNLVKDNRMSDALRLAVRLDQPKRTLDILQKLMLEEDNHLMSADDNMKKKQGWSAPCQLPRLAAALDGLLSASASSATGEASEETVCPYLVKRLLTYVVNWNTRAGTCLAAQLVLNWLLTHWTPEQLLQWPGLPRTVESLLPYTTRHYQRICRLEEQLAIVDYLCDLADEHLVTSLDDSHLPSTKGHLGSSEPDDGHHLATSRDDHVMLVDLSVDTLGTSLNIGRGGNPDIIVPEF